MLVLWVADSPTQSLNILRSGSENDDLKCSEKYKYKDTETTMQFEWVMSDY